MSESSTTNGSFLRAELGGPRRLRYRLAAIGFDLLFFFPIYRLLCLAIASIRGVPFDSDEFNLSTNIFFGAVVSYHGVFRRVRRIRSPGESIVGYTPSGSVVSSTPRRRWLLMLVVANILFATEAPRVPEFVQPNVLFTAEQRDLAVSTSLPTERELGGKVISNSIAMSLFLYGSLRVAQVSAGWMWAAAVYYLFSLILCLGQPVAMLSQAVFLAVILAAIYYYTRGADALLPVDVTRPAPTRHLD